MVIEKIDRRADVPPYKQLADQIRTQIQSGELGPGAALPPESELVATTGLNRTTVRNAIKVLRAEGLLDVRQGRGTFVRVHRLIRRYPIDGIRTEYALIGKVPETPQRDLWSAVAGIGADANVEVTREYSRMQATADLIEAFGAAEEPELELLCRRYVFTIDGQPHQMFWSYLRWDMVEGTPLEDPANEAPHRGTMTQLADIGVRVTTVDMTIRHRMPSPAEARQLDMSEGAPVVIMRSVLFAQDRAVSVGESIIPGDRVELAFRVDLTNP